MTNYVRNRLEITGHKHHVQNVLAAVKSKDKDGKINPFDFNSIIPMPEELTHVSSPVRIVSKYEYIKELKRIEERKANPTDMDKLTGFQHSITKKMSKDYIDRFGANDWYNWSLLHWGTKWGALEPEITSTEKIEEKSQHIKTIINFDTAWSCGARVIQQLSEKFPYVEYKLTFADEDAGQNCGMVAFKEGCQVDSNIPVGGSNEAMEVYLELHGREGWKQINGEWTWNEED